MHTTQYLDSFASYCEGFIMNTGKKNSIVVDEELSFTQSSMSSSLVFGSVYNK